MSYIVEWKETHSGKDWNVVAKKIQNNRYTVIGLAPDKEYMFAVRSATDDGLRSTRTKSKKTVRMPKAKGKVRKQ